MAAYHDATCQDRRTARLTTDHVRTDHRERQTDHDHATTTDGRTYRRTCHHRHGTARPHAHHALTSHTKSTDIRHTHTHERTQIPHDTPHVNTTPRGRGYPRIKNRAAGPLVLTLNASQTIFELHVTHEIFTRIGYATVVAPVGVSRIHLG